MSPSPFLFFILLAIAPHPSWCWPISPPPVSKAVKGVDRGSWLTGGASWTCLGMLAGTLLAPGPVKADDAREAIAKVASSLPGYGKPDTFFPDFFEGSWVVTRECVGYSTPTTEGVEVDAEEVERAKRLVGEKLEYQVRFFRYQDHVIQDRGMNENGLWSARSRDKSPSWREGIVTTWSPSNPNILTVAFPDGGLLEEKVTKRSLEAPSGTQFGKGTRINPCVSEFVRVARARDDSNVGSIPKILAVRVLSRYRRSENGRDIEGLELRKFYPPVSLSLDPDPYLTIKSRLLLRPTDLR